MMYARLASGYRPGAPNLNCGAAGVPCESTHDTTENYELGFKGNVWDGTFSFDASLYYIDWKDIQLALSSPPPGNLGYTGNAGRAKSQGVELSVEAKPFTGSTIAAWIAWNDATLQDPFPASAGGQPAGSRLPFSSEWSGTVSVDQEFPLTAGLTAFVGASASYVDDRAGSIAGQPQFLPSYVQTDARAGVEFGSWTVNAFVNNMGDKRGTLAGIPRVSATAVYIQPRTIGLSLSRTFE